MEKAVFLGFAVGWSGVGDRCWLGWGTNFSSPLEFSVFLRDGAEQECREGQKSNGSVRGTSFGGKTQCFWGGGVRKLPGLKPRLRVLSLASGMFGPRV